MPSVGFFLILLPATVDLLFVRLYILHVNIWCSEFVANCIVLSTFIITVDGVDHLIRLLFGPNHLLSFAFFHFFLVRLPSLPSSFAAPAFIQVPRRHRWTRPVSQLNRFLVATVVA